MGYRRWNERHRHDSCESPLEQAFWNEHRRLWLPGLAGNLTLQYEVLDGQYRLDFAVPQVRLAVEIDGKRWHSTPAQLAADERRQQHLERLGWTFVRWGSDALELDIERCVVLTARKVFEIADARIQEGTEYAADWTLRQLL